MKREALLRVLSTVEPAIAGNDLIPVLTHYWFTGRTVMAYNDVIAISAPYKTNIKGAIRGSLLSGILSKLSGEEVDFSQEGDSVIIKSKRSKMVAPLLSTDTFLFKFPKSGEPTLTLKEKQVGELAAAFDICLQALSRRVSEPQRLGITIVPDKKGLCFYATDSITLSSAALAAKSHSLDRTVTLAKPFCESAQKLLSGKGVKNVSLEVTDEYAILTIGEDDDAILLYGRLVDDPNPPKFKDVVKQYLPEGSSESMVTIPKAFEAALDRAYLVVHKALEPSTQISVVESKNGDVLVRIAAKSEQGEVTESVKIDEHADVSLGIDLSRLRDCDISKFDRILFDEACIVLGRGSDMLHLIATV